MIKKNELPPPEAVFIKSNTTAWSISYSTLYSMPARQEPVIYRNINAAKNKELQKQLADPCSRLKNIAWKHYHLTRNPLSNLKGLVTLLAEFPADENIINCIKQELEKLDKTIIDIANEAVQYAE